jgi:hypothetical protein
MGPKLRSQRVWWRVAHPEERAGLRISKVGGHARWGGAEFGIRSPRRSFSGKPAVLYPRKPLKRLLHDYRDVRNSMPIMLSKPLGYE